MKLLNTPKTGTILISTAVMMIAFLLSSCDGWTLPKELIGRWSSRQEITVRYKTGFFAYRFEKATVDIIATVDDSGKIEGTVGGAKLIDCVVTQNRGWFGKTFHLATDYIARGKLSGSIFPADTIAEKEISMPFNVENSLAKGTLFHNQGAIDFYPLVNFRLKKE
jgi:hypothetical protein